MRKLHLLTIFLLLFCQQRLTAQNLVCPPDIVVQACFASGTVVYYSMPQFNNPNNAPLRGSLSLIDGLPSGTTFPVGTTQVVYRQGYGCGLFWVNTCYAICSFNVTVLAPPNTYYRDFDGDGHGNPAGPILKACSTPSGYSSNNTDCNDNNSAVWRIGSFYRDYDTDGYHVYSTYLCWGALLPEGYSFTSLGPDCNDNDPNINIPPTWYKDADSDGYSDGTMLAQCARPAGYKLLSELTGNSNDCDDNNVNVNPGVTEICANFIDDNCNGQIDEECPAVCGDVAEVFTTDITMNNATFNWVAQVNPDIWELQYKSTAPGSRWVNVTGVLPAHRSVTVTGLSGNLNYMWHIRAKCGNSWTKYSNAVSFITIVNNLFAGRSAIEIPAEAGKAVLGVYPNPTTGRFVVSMQLDEVSNGQATIRLVDVMGRIVETTTAVITNHGLYKTMTLPTSVAKGIYQVQVLVGLKAYRTSLIYTP